MSRRKILDVWQQPALLDLNWPQLRWVQRRHHATHLHSDLRFEANAKLYSWWMYERPSLNPNTIINLRLGKDHDPKYMMGERRIPNGQPGAGPTMVEEYGMFMPTPVSNIAQPRRFHEQFLAGRIELWLEGTYLKGGFLLEGVGEYWTIRKLEDEFASEIEPVWTERSVVSGRTLEEIERDYQEKRKP